MHLGGQIALVANYVLIAGLAIYPLTRPASAVVAFIPDAVVYSAGMALARDWGHPGGSTLDAQADQARKNLERKYCSPKDSPWWCV